MPTEDFVRNFGRRMHHMAYEVLDGSHSAGEKNVDYVVNTGQLASARAPRGDFAFATAVAAFGQLLRGDNMMNGFTHADIDALAGNQNNYWRKEFIKLNALAASMKGG